MRISGKDVESFDCENNGAVEQKEKNDSCVGIVTIVAILIITTMTKRKISLK